MCKNEISFKMLININLLLSFLFQQKHKIVSTPVYYLHYQESDMSNIFNFQFLLLFAIISTINSQIKIRRRHCKLLNRIKGCKFICHLSSCNKSYGGQSQCDKKCPISPCPGPIYLTVCGECDRYCGRDPWHREMREQCLRNCRSDASDEFLDKTT